jgi:hypothetical protein
VPRSKAHDRDLGIRKISSTTRILAGAGIAFVGLFSAFLASRAPSHATASTPVTSQVQPGVTTPVTSQVQPGVNQDGGAAATPVQNSPIENAPAPQAQTRSRGS